MYIISGKMILSSIKPDLPPVQKPGSAPIMAPLGKRREGSPPWASARYVTVRFRHSLRPINFFIQVYHFRQSFTLEAKLDLIRIIPKTVFRTLNFPIVTMFTIIEAWRVRILTEALAGEYMKCRFCGPMSKPRLGITLANAVHG